MRNFYGILALLIIVAITIIVTFGWCYGLFLGLKYLGAFIVRVIGLKILLLSFGLLLLLIILDLYSTLSEDDARYRY